MQTNTQLNLRKLDLKDFPNHKKLLIVMNIPFDISESEISDYFKGVVYGSNHQISEEPITAVKRYEDLGVVSLEFKKKQDSEICLMLDDVREFSNDFKVKMRIFRTKRFISYWNDILKSGGNPLAGLLEGSNQNFKDNFGGFSAPSQPDDGTDREIFMGGLPVNMPELQVRSLCESFGTLKKFQLQKDPMNPLQNKGFCFFEYVDNKATQRAIKGLHNMEFKDKRLKV